VLARDVAPVLDSDADEELRATEDVDATVMLELPPAENVEEDPPPLPRPLRLPLSRGGIRLAYFSAEVVPARRIVCCRSLTSSLAVRSAATADVPVPGVSPAGPSFQYKPAAINKMTATRCQTPRRRRPCAAGWNTSGPGWGGDGVTAGADEPFPWTCMTLLPATRARPRARDNLPLLGIDDILVNEVMLLHRGNLAQALLRAGRLMPARFPLRAHAAPDIPSGKVAEGAL
jgi:hypothetical protein